MSFREPITNLFARALPWRWICFAGLSYAAFMAFYGFTKGPTNTLNVAIPGVLDYAVLPTSLIVFGVPFAWQAFVKKEFMNAFFVALFASMLFDAAGTGSSYVFVGLHIISVNYPLIASWGNIGAWGMALFIGWFFLPTLRLRSKWFLFAFALDISFWAVYRIVPLLNTRAASPIESIPEFICWLGIYMACKKVEKNGPGV